MTTVRPSLFGDLSQILNRTAPLEDLVRPAVQLIRDQLDYGFVVYARVGLAGEFYWLAQANREGRPDHEVLEPSPVPAGRGLIGRAIETSQVQMIGDVEVDPDYVDVVGETESEIVLPITIEGRVVGVLDAQEGRKNAFGGEDREVLRALAEVITVAVHKHALLEDERETARWFQLTNEVNRIMSSSLATRELGRRVVGLISQRFGYEMVALSNVFQDQGIVEHGVSWGLEGEIEMEHQQSIEIGIVGRAVRSKEPVLVLDADQDEDFVAIIDGMVAELCIPLFIDGVPRHVLNIETGDAARFSELAVDQLRALGVIIANGMANAHKYEAEQERASWLELTNEMNAVMNSTLDTLQLRKEIVALVGRRFDYEVVDLVIAEHERGILWRDWHWNNGEVASTYHEAPIDTGVVGKAITSAQSQLVDDVVSEGNYFEVYSGIRSEIAVPLFLEGTVRYVLNIESAQPHYFSEVAVSELATLGMIIANGMANASQFEVERERGIWLEVLNRARGMMSSTLDEAELGKLVVKMLGEEFDYDVVDLISVDHDAGLIRGTFHYTQGGLTEAYHETALDRGVLGRAVREASIQIIRDVSSDPDYESVNPDIEAELCIPLEVENDVQYVLNIEVTDRSRITDVAIAQMKTLGYIFATGLTNARLYQREIERAEELREANAKIRGFYEERSLWFSQLAHELRTPLNGVLGLSQLLELDAPNEEVQTTALDIRSAGQQLLGLVDQLLNFAKLSAGKVEMRKRPFQWNEMERDLQAMLPTLARRAEIDLQFELEGAGFGDPFWLRQVIVNLCSNAIKYAGAGASLRVTTIGDERRTLLKVEDTGKGMTEEIAERLFDPFYQVDIKDRAKGSGLGLAVVKGVVDLHGAEMTVRSAPGQGTSFSIVIGRSVTTEL